MYKLTELAQTYPILKIALSIAILIGYQIIKKLFSKVVLQRAVLHNFEEERANYIKRFSLLVLILIVIIMLGIVWDISLEGLSIYVASIFTVIGVGLFAHWSIVSNITASIILFFFFPFKIGSKVRIVDGENSAEGKVLSISLFSIQIQREDGKNIYYPNNLAIQKSIIHLD